MPENLSKFRKLCRELISQGIKPTPTEFAKRGWPYVTVANDRLYARRVPRMPIANPGSGTTWTHGKYAAARREELIAAGYVWHAEKGYHGTWDTGISLKP